MSIDKVFYMTFIVFCIFALPGCMVEDGKVTGGGTMASLSDGHKAVMGFNADSCGGEEVTGRFNFHDAGFKGAKGGLKMMGHVTGVDKCVEEGGNGRENMACDSSFYHASNGCQEGYVVAMKYRSTNPKAKGSGTAEACVVDNGTKNIDAVWINVTSGPFAGYYNHGTMSGNVQSHECDS